MTVAKELQPEQKKRGRPRGSADITKLSGVLEEMASLYRLMKAGKLAHGVGTRLVWSLTQIRDTLTIASIDARLTELEEENRAYEENRALLAGRAGEQWHGLN